MNFFTIDINNIAHINATTKHSFCVVSLFLLFDRKLTSCSSDNKINIYNMNNYLYDMTISKDRVICKK